MVARWFAALVLVGCSHPAPTPRSGGSAPARGADDEIAGASAAPVTHDAPAGQLAGNEVHTRPIDGNVIEKHADGANLRFMIGLPPEAKADDLTVAWTGMFVRDGNAVPGTEFKLLSIKPHAVFATIPGQQLPSETVRLYEPYYPANLKR